jgi:hypothetical protein
MQVCLPKHNYKLDNNLLTVETRAVDPHCFYADPDPAQNLDADPDPDPDPGGGGGVGQPKMCMPPGKILVTPLYGTVPDITQYRYGTYQVFSRSWGLNRK